MKGLTIAFACAVLAVFATVGFSEDTSMMRTVHLVHNDTLPRFAADSVVTTNPISIDGARGYTIWAVSSGTDTITVAHQTRLPGTAEWSGAGGQTALPGVLTAISGGLNLTTAGKNAFTFYGSLDAGVSGTPLPINGDIRLRLKSADARRYATASSATLAATGTVKVFVSVIK